MVRLIFCYLKRKKKMGERTFDGGGGASGTIDGGCSTEAWDTSRTRLLVYEVLMCSHLTLHICNVSHICNKLAYCEM
jgi:hypothetical protein